MITDGGMLFLHFFAFLPVLMWYRKGENGGKMGIFPSSCVAEVNPAPKQENGIQTAIRKSAETQDGLTKPKISVVIFFFLHSFFFFLSFPHLALLYCLSCTVSYTFLKQGTKKKENQKQR
jgi:hypothetical protein